MLPRLSAAFVLFAWLAFAAPAFAQQAQVTINSPANGATVTGPDVTVSITVSGTTLVPAAQATKREDLHVHYMLDVDPAPYMSGTTPLPQGNPNIVHSGATSNTFSNVASGSHTVTVLLGYADHTAVQPPVAPSVTFSVAGTGGAASQLPSTGNLADIGVLLVALGVVGVVVGTAARFLLARGR
jgi:hypothetical protein